VQILYKLSTETKCYSSHIILHFNLPTKQRSLLSMAIHWRRPSNVLLSSIPIQWPNAVTARRHAPDDNAADPCSQLDGGGAAPTPPIQHDPQSWKLVVKRPPTNLCSSHCCRRWPCRTFPYRKLSHRCTSTNTPHNAPCQ